VKLSKPANLRRSEAGKRASASVVVICIADAD